MLTSLLRTYRMGGGTSFVYRRSAGPSSLSPNPKRRCHRQNRIPGFRWVNEKAFRPLERAALFKYDKAMFAPLLEPAILHGVGPRIAESALGLITNMAGSARSPISD